MSYAIIRNVKYKRANLQGIFRHNERRNKNYSNENINKEKSYLNYSIKSPQYSYEKEFDRIRERYNLKGQIKTVSNIACEYIITSDHDYFETAYKFVVEYKNLGKQYIMSAKVHMDEQTPHMHLVFLPVVHTTDKKGNSIDKLACSEFWKAKDSYRQLQDAFFEFMVENGFNLQRGLPKEETGRGHYSVEEYKKITNFKQTKEILNNMKLELPDIPDIADININRLSKKRDEKILEEIIKPKDNVIQNLYQDNMNLHRQLSRQAQVIEEAEKYQKEKNEILKENQELKTRCRDLEKEFETKTENLKNEYDREMRQTKKKFIKIIDELDNENVKLHKIIDRFKVTVSKFITWICRDFQKETNMNFRVEEQIEHETMIDKEEEELDMW